MAFERTHYLPTKIIKGNLLFWHAPVVTHLEDGLVHEGWSAEVELDVLGCVMLTEVLVDHRLVHEAKEAISIGVIYILLLYPVILW